MHGISQGGIKPQRMSEPHVPGEPREYQQSHRRREQACHDCPFLFFPQVPMYTTGESPAGGPQSRTGTGSAGSFHLSRSGCNG